MFWYSKLRLCCNGAPASAMELVTQPRSSSLPKSLMQRMLACTGTQASLVLSGKEFKRSYSAMNASMPCGDIDEQVWKTI